MASRSFRLLNLCYSLQRSQILLSCPIYLSNMWNVRETHTSKCFQIKKLWFVVISCFKWGFFFCNAFFDNLLNRNTIVLLPQPKISLATLYHESNSFSSPLLSYFSSPQHHFAKECKVQSIGVQCLELHKTC